MSRGLGCVEKEVLQVLADLQRPATGVLIIAYCSGRNLKSDNARVRRALASLLRKGLVEKEGNLWRMPNGSYKNKRQRREKQESQPWFAPSKVNTDARNRLAKLMGMMGSTHEGEIVAAAKKAEAERVKLGLTWGQIIGTE